MKGLKEVGLEYIQLFKDMEMLFDPYDDAQRGRLIMAMMAYAYRGEEPQFDGVEKFIWPVLRQHIDRCAQNVEAKKAAGSKGGKRKSEDKQTEAEESTFKQAEAEESKPNQTEADGSESKKNSHTQYHDHEHDHDHSHNEEVVTRVRARTAAAAEPVDAIDGSDLTETIAVHQEAERLIKLFGLPHTETALTAILDDIDEHGLSVVEQALHDASLSDSRGGLSIRFYRTKLPGAQPRPSPRQQDTSDPFRQLYREEGYS